MGILDTILGSLLGLVGGGQQSGGANPDLLRLLFSQPQQQQQAQQPWMQQRHDTAVDPANNAWSTIVPQQYRSLVQQSAQQEGVSPAVLAALLKQESGYNPNARSPVGAQGIAQFMPATAKQMGINPLDPNQAIPAAAKYLAQNMRMKGSGGDIWNAVAGYNAGPGRMNPAQWNRIPETSNYVQRIRDTATRLDPSIGRNPFTPAPAPQQRRPVGSTAELTPEQQILLLLGLGLG